METEIIFLELKYCESCGGLWLRPTGSTQVECASCLAHPPRFCLPSERIRRAHLPIRRGLDHQSSSAGVLKSYSRAKDWGRS